MDLSQRESISGNADNSGPCNLKTICDGAFTHCEKLVTVILPEGLDSISSWCFLNTGIRTILIPKSVRCIEDSAFYNCYSLKQVIFQEDSELCEIREEVFADTSLKTFTAPPLLRKVGGEAFYGCKSLSKVVLNEGLTTLYNDNDSVYHKYSIFENSALRTIVLPSTLKQIFRRTFKNCRFL